MNKLKRLFNIFGKLPTWILVGAFIVSLSFSIISLRQNNQQMIKLRDQVYEADKNAGDVNTALNNLRSYVYGHMNANLSSGGNAIKPPIQLKYTYQRLEDAEQQRVESANSSVYTDAQMHCQALNSTSFSGRDRVPCVQEYVSSHGVKTNAIPPALYQFDFVSPSWSPDRAGWSIVVTAVLFIALIASLLMDWLVRSKIKSQQV
jgi:hypothetical protein